MPCRPQAALIDGPLGRSGFLAAFSLIFLSEIGDKTFFIAALLAMRLGRLVSFIGSVAALGVMTVISVGIGAVFSKVPDALRSSVPIGEIAGVVLLVVFGLKALRVGGGAVRGGARAASRLPAATAAACSRGVQGCGSKGLCMCTPCTGSTAAR
jgi:putative Ca2+/H+ antiporter (TMEM165/GDT1 family)